MQMAKPHSGEFDTVYRFLSGMESIIERGCLPVGEGDEYDEIECESAEEKLAWIENAWDAVSPSWQRVLMAGQVAIENACDPDATVLKFKPEIAAAMKAAGIEA